MGVIGLNNQGKDHVEAILRSENAVLAAVCDTQISFRDAYDVPFFSTMDELLRSGLVDGVVIALPHDLHEGALRLAAAHGVHVLKEKPLARTLEEAHRVLQATARSIVIHTGVQRRHHLTYAALREHLHGKHVISSSLDMMVVPKPRAHASPDTPATVHPELVEGWKSHKNENPPQRGGFRMY